MKQTYILQKTSIDSHAGFVIRPFPLLFLLCLLLLSTAGLQGQEHYYWYKGKKVPLQIDSTTKYLLMDDVTDSATLNTVVDKKKTKIESYQKLQTTYDKENRKNRHWAIVHDSSRTSYKNKDKITYEACSYKLKGGTRATLSHLFYVKLKKAEDEALLNKLAQQQNVEILGNNKFMPLWYTLACSKKSKGNALEMANWFYEYSVFESTFPDLMADVELLCVNDDPLFNIQWGLEHKGQHGGTLGLDIKYCEAHEITTGSTNIAIAVIDQEIERNHPDLNNLGPLYYDTKTDNSIDAIYGAHGTLCAGIIGAEIDNNKGVSGIAPECPIISISHFFGKTQESAMELANGINYAWQNGASVLSCSWRHRIQNPILDESIRNALYKGRNGLGCVLVFASGNSIPNIDYPANTIRDLLVVGAMSPCGERKSLSSCDNQNWYSAIGAELDVMAPGVHVPTTDLLGAEGYDHGEGEEGDYEEYWLGTSAACPHVAALAGLILSEHPNLTQDEVVRIIESTAQKVSESVYNYHNESRRPNGLWNEEMGYGLIDAYTALLVDVCEPVTISDNTYNTSQSFEGCQIRLRNINATSSAILTTNAETRTQLIGNTTVELGARLIINK